MAVRVYRPAVQVTLTKLVQRSGEGVAERYTGAARTFDLTPYLSDSGAVKVQKGITEPAGSFTIAFSDRLDPDTLDSLYARIEPMDAIEIRAAREPHRFAGQQLPLIMRGFVSAVRRPEAVQPDGSPQRFVVVQGQDSGKLWLIFRVFWESIYGNEANPYLDVFRLQASQNMEVAFLPVADAMRQVTERIVNQRVASMAAYAQQVLRPFATDRITVRQGIVSPNLIAPFEGPFWSLVELMADRPWNEAFIEDEEDAPRLVFRPTPFKDIRGALIMPGAVDPGTVELTAADVVSLELGRSDQRVANFFYVPPGASMLDSSQLVNVAAIAAGAPFDTNYGNNRPELYGLRKMVAESRLLPDGLTALPAQLPQPQQVPAATNIVQWHVERSRLLRDMNRDNSVLEEGSATVIGREDLRPGRYLRLTRGDLAAEAYVTRVSHNINPLESWTTNLTLERGTGFLERLRMRPSPYLREGRRGPYSAR